MCIYVIEAFHAWARTVHTDTHIYKQIYMQTRLTHIYTYKHAHVHTCKHIIIHLQVQHANGLMN